MIFWIASSSLVFLASFSFSTSRCFLTSALYSSKVSNSDTSCANSSFSSGSSFALYFVDLNLEHCRLSGKICCLILLREGYVYFYFVAGILAYELILERIDEGMGTDLKRMILTLAALKCNAINKSLEVDHCGIAVCDRSVCNGNSSCVVISLFLYCCLYLFVRYGGIDLGYLNTKILAKLLLPVLQQPLL